MRFDYYRLIGPLLRSFDPETAHRLTVGALRRGLAPAGAGRATGAAGALLETSLWGMRFPNPLGLAAGFDKNAETVDAALGLGFGFVEVGTVTLRPQPGNPRPRLFRLPADGAVINRMGFNNFGIEAMRRRLELRRVAGRRGLVGANVGPNKDAADPVADCAHGVAVLAPLVDYLVVNVSSPNTPGLRGLQAPGALLPLLEAVLAARAGSGAAPPLLVKIAPDLTPEDLDGIVEAALAAGIDGLVATNTTIARPAGLRDRHRGETGGLSGRPLFAPSTAVLGELYRLSQGRIPLIGVGGISSGADAYAKIRAGASLVQLYTALVYNGPGLVKRILTDLASLLRADGLTRLDQAVGADARTGPGSATVAGSVETASDPNLG